MGCSRGGRRVSPLLHGENFVFAIKREGNYEGEAAGGAVVNAVVLMYRRSGCPGRSNLGSMRPKGEKKGKDAALGPARQSADHRSLRSRGRGRLN